jgi:hypothetical protein
MYRMFRFASNDVLLLVNSCKLRSVVVDELGLAL